MTTQQLTAPERVIVGVAMMDQVEARATVEQVKTHLDGARRLLLDLYEREGWRALGYVSWQTCATAEFGQSSAHVYRLLTAAQIEQAIDSPIGEYPESHLRPLTKLPTPDQQRAAIDRATEIAGDRPRTAQHVKQAVAEIALPPDFGDVTARLAARGVTLTSEVRGDRRWYVTHRTGKTTGIATPTWSNVVDSLEYHERKEVEAVAAPPEAAINTGAINHPDGSPAAFTLNPAVCRRCGETTTEYTVYAPGLVREYPGRVVLCSACVPALLKERAAAPTESDRAAHLAKEQADKDMLDMAEVEIASGNVNYARTLLGRVSEASAYRRDQLLAALPPAPRLSLPIELQKRLVAAGAKIMGDGTVIAPQQANEASAVLNEAEAEAAIVRWAALPKEPPTPAAPALTDWWNCLCAIDRAMQHKKIADACAATFDLLRLLSGDDPRKRAAALLIALDRELKGLTTEDQEGLSMAINELNECEEGTEARYWLRVGYALLDLEADDA